MLFSNHRTALEIEISCTGGASSQDGRKWLATPIYKPWKGHLQGEQPYLGDLLTMVINHLLAGMILQVGGESSKMFA